MNIPGRINAEYFRKELTETFVKMKMESSLVSIYWKS